MLSITTFPVILSCIQVTEVLLKLLSGSSAILTITWKWGMLLWNIWRRVVCSVSMNVSPSNLFPAMLSAFRFCWKCQAAFGCCDPQWFINGNGVLKMIFVSFYLFWHIHHAYGLWQLKVFWLFWWYLFWLKTFKENIFTQNLINNMPFNIL